MRSEFRLVVRRRLGARAGSTSRAVLLLAAALAGSSQAAVPGAAFAHGGAYQPPPVGDPTPGTPPPPAPPTPTDAPPPTDPTISAEPSGERDPEPPPPPPSPPTFDDGSGTPPKSDGDAPPPPTTPGSGNGPPTGGPGTPPGGGTGPNTGATQPPTGSKRRSSGLSPDHWTRWWYANRTTLLELDVRALANAETTPGGASAAGALELQRAELQMILAEAAMDDSRHIASSAALALGKLGDPGDVPTLSMLLLDAKRPGEVREAAALALGLVRATDDAASAKGTAALRRAASDESSQERLRAIAAWSLGLRRDLAAVPFLRELAEDERAGWDLRSAAVSALGLTGCPIVREDLERWLVTEGPRKLPVILRVHAAHGLARLGAPESAPALLRVLREDEEDVRRAAILALGAVGGHVEEPKLLTDCVERLVHMMERDRDRACRNMAAIALGRLGDRRAQRALRYAYEKGDNLHQPFAAIGLGLLARSASDPTITAPLRRDLADRADQDLRGALAIAVGLGRDVENVKSLREIVTDRGLDGLRPHAAFALGLLDDRGSAKTLRKLLDDERAPDFQREGAMALGLLGDTEAAKQLSQRIAESDSIYVQGAAATALGRIGGPMSTKTLRELAADRSRPEMARAFGIVGIGLILDRSQGRGLARIGADLDWYLQSPSVTEILTIL